MIHINKILDLNNLNEFDIIVSGEEFNSSKPDPECYSITLKKLKLKPEEVIIVEDSPAGIQAAKSLGIKVFGLGTYFDKKTLDVDPFFLDHTEILNYIKKVYKDK